MLVLYIYECREMSELKSDSLMCVVIDAFVKRHQSRFDKPCPAVKVPKPGDRAAPFSLSLIPPCTSARTVWMKQTDSCLLLF